MEGSHTGNKSWVIYGILLHFLAIANVFFIEKWQKLQFGFLLCRLPAFSPSPFSLSLSFPGWTCFGFRRWKFMEADEHQGDWIQAQIQWACCQILSTLTENTVSRKRRVIIKKSDLASNLHKNSWTGFWFSFLNKQNNASWLAVPKVFPFFPVFWHIAERSCWCISKTCSLSTALQKIRALFFKAWSCSHLRQTQNFSCLQRYKSRA